ncbi:bifunctional DNA primase/polymerase [Actinomadura roseirufa]|uniref:bifunctional DNA primase/polymerase n=1 Tax=Actinomadura roseirufa TaxID=2094049 RepID=UPI001041130A|nr:bifunctional DNA primase/polymerase [Actinomadura roseirufa]
MNGTLPYALAAARRGWHVFPLRARRKTPLARFTDWERHATTDPGRITAFWSRGPFNVAVACGPSRLVVIDLDMPKPGERPPAAWALPGVNEGADAFAVLCERHGQPYPTDTFTVRTRRGGTHLYFDAPPGAELRNTSGRHGWLIDTRACGGYVVGPGSVVDLPDGAGSYDVVNDAPPAPLPTWLRDVLTAPAPTPRPHLSAPSPAGVADLDGYLQAALKGEAQRVTEAQIGQRNYALNKAAYNLGRLVGSGALPEPLVRAVLVEAVSVHYSPGKDGFTESEALATIAAALTAGARRPRTITRRQEAA